MQRKFHKYSMCSLRNKQHDIKFIADSLFWGNSQGSGGRVLGETRRIRSDYSVAASGTRISLHVSQVLICQLSLEVFLLTKKKKKSCGWNNLFFRHWPPPLLGLEDWFPFVWDGRGRRPWCHYGGKGNGWVSRPEFHPLVTEYQLCRHSTGCIFSMDGGWEVKCKLCSHTAGQRVTCQSLICHSSFVNSCGIRFKVSSGETKFPY